MSRTTVLSALALVVLGVPALRAASPTVEASLQDRRTPVRLEILPFSAESDSVWERALAEVLAQPTQPAGNQLPVPPLESSASLPLDKVEWSEVERFRIPGAGNRALEVLMVLDDSTADEAQAMLDTVRAVHSAQEAAGLPEEERLKAHFVLGSRGSMHDLDVSAEDYAKLVVVDRYYETYDVWMQDWGEIGAVTMAGSDTEELCVFDSRRGRGLGDFPPTLARQWAGKMLEGPSAWGTKGNYGGDIEATPDDVLVIGDTSTAELRQRFAAAGYADRMVVLESQWLRVGHIDEYLSFLPVPESEAGYVIVKADATRAMEILKGLDDEAWETSLAGVVHAAFRPYRSFPGIVGDKYGVREEFQDIVALRAALRGGETASEAVRARGRQLIGENQQAAAIVDGAIAKLQAYLKQVNGGVEVPVVSFPGLFTSDGSYRALLPGVSNLVVLEGHLVIPDPLVPELREDIRAEVEALGLVPHFVPNLTYHYMNGEMHCGSIVRRHPQRFTHERYARAARFRQTLR